MTFTPTADYHTNGQRDELYDHSATSALRWVWNPHMSAVEQRSQQDDKQCKHGSEHHVGLYLIYISPPYDIGPSTANREVCHW